MYVCAMSYLLYMYEGQGQKYKPYQAISYNTHYLTPLYLKIVIYINNYITFENN